MIKMEQSIVINCPREQVFAFIANPENETKWQADLAESKFTTTGPVGVGTKGRDLRRFMGRQIETTWEITEYQPSHKMAFRVITGPIPFQALYTFESKMDGTKLTFSAQAKTKGFSKLFDPLVNRMGQKQYERDLAALKTVLETQA
jgi:uncharacterized protein YndB with AHSA1/START domain